MLEPKEPKYQWGQSITTKVDLVNDGSYPDAPINAVLEKSGSKGEIVNVGVVEDTRELVYLVEFTDGKVIGVFEEEISLA